MWRRVISLISISASGQRSWRQQNPPKRRYLSTRLNGATSQKTISLVLTPARISCLMLTWDHDSVRQSLYYSEESSCGLVNRMLITWISAAYNGTEREGWFVYTYLMTQYQLLSLSDIDWAAYISELFWESSAEIDVIWAKRSKICAVLRLRLKPWAFLPLSLCTGPYSGASRADNHVKTHRGPLQVPHVT
jgi:hypothetical protein